MGSTAPSSQAPLKLTVNGEAMTFPGVETITDLLAALEMTPEAGSTRVAVAVNLHVIPKAEHQRHGLKAGDQVEIIQAVGGG